MKISVIIPAYNSEQYLFDSVKSAVMQGETDEVIIIEDGSQDKTLDIAKNISTQFEIVRLLTHERGENKGRSASRNLGISSAKNEWISFLDSDDYFLPDRFQHLLHREREGIDGWYDLMLTVNESPKPLPKEMEDITGIQEEVPPSQLFDFLVEGKSHFSLNGLVVKKSLLDSIGRFDEDLAQGEDTDLIWRLARKSRLASGLNKNPVVIRRVHGKNTYFNQRKTVRSRYVFYDKWLELSRELDISVRSKKIIEDRRKYYRMEYKHPKLSVILNKLPGPLRRVLYYF